MDELNSKYELLILKELEGELSLRERMELEKWAIEPQNRIFYEEQKKLWESTESFRRMRKIDKKKALKKVELQLFGRLSIRILRNLERVAAVLFIPLLLSAAWLFYSQYVKHSPDNEVVFNSVEIPLGMRSSMVLPDGTTVWLNGGTKLTYPVAFSGKNRQVELNGEAYFDVTTNKQKPFIVSTSAVQIRVLGTSFNCSAYPQNEKIETALVAGEIEIFEKKGNKTLNVVPGELAIFSKQNEKMTKIKADLEKYISWKSGKLIFRDDPMTRVIEKLGRWYNVEFQINDQEILTYVYSATFSGESLDQVLKMLALSAPIHYELFPRKRLDDQSYERQIIKLTKNRPMQ